MRSRCLCDALAVSVNVVEGEEGPARPTAAVGGRPCRSGRGRQYGLLMTTPEPEPPAGDLPESTINRNWTELVQELRAIQVGVQVLIGFLLAVPYTDRFATLDHFAKVAYLAVLSLAVAATAAVLAPIAYHRILFRRALRPWLVETANTVARAGLVLAALAMCGVVFLAFDLAVGTVAGVGAAVVAVVGYVVLWLVVPLRAHPPVRSR